MSATTSVAVVEGVAPGWTLLDNFDQYPAGNLFANGYWNDVSGASAQVLGVNGNNGVKNATGGGIVYLNLRDLAIAEGQARTLFFRMITGADNATGATNIVGLTDKSQRGFADEFLNIGPVLYAAAWTNDVIGMETNAWYLGARYGYLGGNSSNPVDFPGPALGSAVVYNVWLDVTNTPLADTFASDTFTVTIQKEGDTQRTVIFQDYISDRDPFFVDAVLGGMLPSLDKLVVMGNSATYNAVFDDFYLSTSGYNSTVPKAYGSASLPPGPMSIRRVGTQVEISWTNGVLQSKSSITGTWADVSGSPSSPHLVTPSATSVFYRVRQ